MRRSTALQPTESIPWRSLGNTGLLIRELNCDPVTGARTSLLKSPPRPQPEAKAQYHFSEEEFFCLAGRFTFDGNHWFRPGSYACFPAGVVHGADVRVPDGYLLYLRTSGSTEAVRVAQPRSSIPYRDDGRDDAPQAVLLDAELAAESPQRQILRRDKERSVELWRVRAGWSRVSDDWSSAPIELIVVSGELQTDGRVLQTGTYGFYGVAEPRPALLAISESVLLVHIGDWP